MMERYSGDFLAAVDGLRALLGPWTRVAGQRRSRDVCADTPTAKGHAAGGEVDKGPRAASRHARVARAARADSPAVRIAIAELMP